jgi:preprotein translocase subunit SecE
MSILKVEDSRKWINSFTAVVSIIAGFLTIRFVQTMGEWFDLEPKIPNFPQVAQGLGVLLGLALFVYLYKKKEAQEHLSNVYGELVKAIWPDKDTILKITVGLVISLSIVSGIFVLIDYIFRSILEMIY